MFFQLFYLSNERQGPDKKLENRKKKLKQGKDQDPTTETDQGPEEAEGSWCG